MMPSPHDLMYFREAATVLNMSRAAERIGISQPSLSLAIQRIEDLLGEKIFHRSKRGVRLTQPGSQLLSHTNFLISAWDKVKSKAIASSKEIQGRYVIGCHTSVALYSLSSFLPYVLQEQPSLEIGLLHDLSRKITEAVVSSTVDIGIVVNPVKHPDLIITKMADDDVTFWVPKDQPQISGSKVSLIYDPDLIQSQSLLKKAAKTGLQISRLIETTSLEVVAELTATGAGVGILPTRVANRASKQLRKLRDLPVFRDEICLIVRSENRSIAAIKYLTTHIKNSFK